MIIRKSFTRKIIVLTKTKQKSLPSTRKGATFAGALMKSSLSYAAPINGIHHVTKVTSSASAFVCGGFLVRQCVLPLCIVIASDVENEILIKTRILFGLLRQRENLSCVFSFAYFVQGVVINGVIILVIVYVKKGR